MIDVPRWAALFNEPVHSPFEDVEEGFVTRDDIAAELGLSCGGTLTRKLDWLVKQGKLEQRVYRVRDARGRSYPKVHYRIKE